MRVNSHCTSHTSKFANSLLTFMFFPKLLLVVPTTEWPPLSSPVLVYLLPSEIWKCPLGPLMHLRFIIPMSLIASQPLHTCSPTRYKQPKQNKTSENLQVSEIHTTNDLLSLTSSNYMFNRSVLWCRWSSYSTCWVLTWSKKTFTQTRGLC